jgi:hypothetical protein
MTFLSILLGIVYVACWIYFGLATVPQGPLLDVLDRVLPPVSVDHRRLDRPHRTRRRMRSRHCLAAAAQVPVWRRVEDPSAAALAQVPPNRPLLDVVESPG